jgi:hypothetical protein
MRTNHSENDLESRAVRALRSLLGEVSVVKLKDIKSEAHGDDDIGFVAHVDVLGRSHTLACEVRSSVQPEGLRTALRDGQGNASSTRIIIAPYISPEAQALCKESHAGFLDLQGNARIALGEVFIGKRSVAPRAAQQIPTIPTNAAAPAMKPFAPRQASQSAPRNSASCQA